MKVVEDGDKMEVTNSMILLEENALHRNLDFVTFISKYSALLFLSLRQHEFDIFTIFFISCFTIKSVFIKRKKVIFIILLVYDQEKRKCF